MECLNNKLFQAVCLGRVETVTDLLKTYDPADTKETVEEYDLLCIAVENKHVEVAKLLIKTGFKVRSKEKKPLNTPLYFAVKYGYIEIVETLLGKGVDVNSRNRDGVTPLHVAVERGCLQIFEYLLNNGADVNSSYNSSSSRVGYTPLHLAVENNNNLIANLLIKRGAIVNAMGDDGITPLHIAAEKGYKDMAELLLNQGADVNLSIPAKSSSSPLHVAVSYQSEEIVELFLNRGAFVDPKGEDGITPLHIAAEKGQIIIVKYLLKHEADVNAVSVASYISTRYYYRHGFCPLHFAAEKGHTAIVTILLQFGAVIDAKDKNGKTALELASVEAKVDVVRTLLEQGADINLIMLDNFPPPFFGDRDLSFFNTAYEVVAEMLNHHLVKLKMANLYVSEKKLQAITNNTALQNFHSRCENEISRMKNEKFQHSNTSFYNILNKSVDQLAILLDNENIFDVLKSEDYKTDFPIYASMINFKFRNALTRNTLFRKSELICDAIFPKLPHVFIQKLLSYLSNKELEIFTGME